MSDFIVENRGIVPKSIKSASDNIEQVNLIVHSTYKACTEPDTEGALFLQQEPRAAATGPCAGFSSRPESRPACCLSCIPIPAMIQFCRQAGLKGPCVTDEDVRESDSDATMSDAVTGDGAPFTAQAIIANPPVYGHLHVAEKMGISVRRPQPFLPGCCPHSSAS